MNCWHKFLYTVLYFPQKKIKSKKETSEALFKINTRNRLIPVLRGQDHEVTPKYKFPYGKLKSKIKIWKLWYQFSNSVSAPTDTKQVTCEFVGSMFEKEILVWVKCLHCPDGQPKKLVRISCIFSLSLLRSYFLSQKDLG